MIVENEQKFERNLDHLVVGILNYADFDSEKLLKTKESKVYEVFQSLVSMNFE